MQMLPSEAFGDGRREMTFLKMGKCGDGVISAVEYLMGMLKKGMAKSMAEGQDLLCLTSMHCLC